MHVTELVILIATKNYIQLFAKYNCPNERAIKIHAYMHMYSIYMYMYFLISGGLSSRALVNNNNRTYQITNPQSGLRNARVDRKIV